MFAFERMRVSDACSWCMVGDHAEYAPALVLGVSLRWRESTTRTFVTTRGFLCGVFAEPSGGGVRARGPQGGSSLRAAVGLCFESARRCTYSTSCHYLRVNIREE